MKISRIVLFVLGNGNANVKIKAQALKEEICHCITSTCEGGSIHGACFATYNGKEFDTPIRTAVNNVRANPKLTTHGISATSINCVFVVNNNLKANEWKSCFETVRRELNDVAVTYYAIVQRDSIDSKKDIAEALTSFGMAVYCFQQQTQNGYIIQSDSDEKQLMAYYSLLAGTGVLPSSPGIYTGSFNKLSLMADDFSRIRNYFIVHSAAEGTNGAKMLDDNMFNAFFGKWIGQNVTTTSSIKLLYDAMNKKLKPLFPGAEELALMANKELKITRANIDRFIAINFESERFGLYIEKLLNGNQSIVRNWSEEFDNMLRTNVDYYCEKSCRYIHDMLVPWIRKSAEEIRNYAMVEPNAVPGDEKDFIAYAITLAAQKMSRYIGIASAEMLNAIAGQLEEKAAMIRKRIKRCRELFESKQWILDEDEIKDFERYAQGIISDIATYCRENNLPHAEITNADTYYGDGNIELAWEYLVNDLNDQIQNQFKERADLIATLSAANAAEFKERVPQVLQDRGLRLSFGNSQIQPAAGEPKTIYICSDSLGISTNGKELPYATNGNCKQFEIHDFDNILQFNVVQLMNTVSEHKPDDAEYREKLLNALPDSTRHERARKNTADNDDNTDAGHNAARTGSTINNEASVKFIDNKLRVTLPHSVTGTVDYTLTGYLKDGVKAPPRPGHPPADNLRQQGISLQGLYGRCTIELKKGDQLILKAEFDGPKTEATGYEISRPSMFGKSKNVSGYDFKAEHIIFKLAEKDDAALEACINPYGVNTPEAIRYPVGEGRKWDVWAGPSIMDSLVLEANDKERIRQLEET